MALIPRVDNVLFDDWRHTRCFKFGNNNIEIHQNWEGNGVAGVVWDAAITLALYLWTHPEVVRNKFVLELGSGTGLCSIVVGLLGSSIIATDKSDVLPLLQFNLNNNLNKVTDNFINKDKCPRFMAQEFDWYSPPSNLVNESFDVIIGSDLVYDVNLFPLLVSVFHKVLNGDNYILLSTRIRYNKDEDFIGSLSTNYKFKVEEVYRCNQSQVIISKIYVPS